MASSQAHLKSPPHSGTIMLQQEKDPELVVFDAKFICPIHNGLFRDPVQTRCGHRMCRSCVDDYLDGLESRPCPVDDDDVEQVTKDGVNPDRGIMREMKELKVYCPFRGNGCTDILRHKDVNDHTTKCIYQPTPCKNSAKDCQTVLALCRQAQHEEACEFRQASGKKCGQDIHIREMKDHEVNQCPERIIPCCHDNCGVKMKPRQTRNSAQTEHSATARRHLGSKIEEDNRKEMSDVLAIMEVQREENDLRFQMLETATYDGILLWKIRDVAMRKRDAVSGKIASLFSQPFYTSRHGYKMCAKVYLNGDGVGKGTHVSLYFVLMKGEYDALLPWPFQLKITLMILDQSTHERHLKEEFVPGAGSAGFKRPEAKCNIAIGCPHFVMQSKIFNSANRYIVDDVVFVKVSADCTQLRQT